MQTSGGVARSDRGPLGRPRSVWVLIALLAVGGLVLGGQLAAGAAASAYGDGPAPVAGATSDRLFVVRPPTKGADHVVTRGRGAGRPSGPVLGVLAVAAVIGLAAWVLVHCRSGSGSHAHRWWAGRAQWRGPPALGLH